VYVLKDNSDNSREVMEPAKICISCAFTRSELVPAVIDTAIQLSYLN